MGETEGSIVAQVLDFSYVALLSTAISDRLQLKTGPAAPRDPRINIHSEC